MRGHCYDAMVTLAGCDKSLPGMMMAMLRLNVPSVFMYGGSILPGKFRGKDVTVVDVFEGVGMHAAGKFSDSDLHELECAACPSAGSCGGQFTANTMACVSEAIGLALPGSAGAPAPYETRDQYAEASGEAAMNLLRLGIRPRDICSREAFENAAVVVAATGGSTNAGLHRRRWRMNAASSSTRTWRRSSRRRLHRRPRRAESTWRSISQCRRHPDRHQGTAGCRPPARRVLTATGKTPTENHKDGTFPETRMSSIG